MQPGVLHRALREVGERDQVELLLRVRDAVVVGEPVQGEGADLEREPGEVQPAGHGRRPGSASAPRRRLGEARGGPTTTPRGRSTSRIVSANRTRAYPGSAGSRSISGAFEIAVRSSGTTSVIGERRLEVGLVPAREARRASVASNCVVAMTCSRPASSVKRERYIPSIRSLSLPVNSRRRVYVAGRELPRQLERDPAGRGVGHRLGDLDRRPVARDDRAGAHGRDPCRSPRSRSRARGPRP